MESCLPSGRDEERLSPVSSSVTPIHSIKRRLEQAIATMKTASLARSVVFIIGRFEASLIFRTVVQRCPAQFLRGPKYIRAKKNFCVALKRSR